MERKKEGRPLQGTDYRLVRRIGEGSTSEVHEAIGPHGEACAIKILRRSHARSWQATARHLQEIRALAVLDHPHVVRVEDAGVTHDGRPFLVMPRLDGETLRARLDERGPLSQGAAVRIACQILAGLSAAHRAGIVHRDIKPANVFLAQPPRSKALLGRAQPERQDPAETADLGRVVLLDFGIAKVSWGGLPPTSGSHVIGTPRYLAPEQLIGGAIDGRTDLYAVGMLLFEAIAGRGPFPDTDALAIMRAHIRTAPASLRDVADVGPALDQVVARAIAKTPHRRWPSADAMSQALLAASLKVVRGGARSSLPRSAEAR
ncbi:serine/threonine-protein kinase [Chondromyces apiculatus]|uniref:Serine/threonine protein kinase n=1 Tax=Chondromyces apiculatus DSM 436 TaxID=1192034 RepID=A0A017T677_9BACT|nr:serine/threonine-protein kinase [Chondromyces apiculatus]EYF04768.1 serine/threonine protein kinase [Chondromyces apiculatus DSM 436]